MPSIITEVCKIFEDFTTLAWTQFFNFHTWKKLQLLLINCLEQSQKMDFFWITKLLEWLILNGKIVLAIYNSYKVKGLKTGLVRGDWPFCQKLKHIYKIMWLHADNPLEMCADVWSSINWCSFTERGIICT